MSSFSQTKCVLRRPVGIGLSDSLAVVVCVAAAVLAVLTRYLPIAWMMPLVYTVGMVAGLAAVCAFMALARETIHDLEEPVLDSSCSSRTVAPSTQVAARRGTAPPSELTSQMHLGPLGAQPLRRGPGLVSFDQRREPRRVHGLRR